MHSSKKIFVHCGLHKTGTTALQEAFKNHEGALRELGILYPRSGRLDTLGGGHHALAWQLTGDRRYDPAFGGFADLQAELSAFDGNALISSEDFETLLDAPEDFHRLYQALSGSGREIVLVIYLRSQLAYCQSLFIENILQNIGSEYDIYVREICRFGRLPLREWVFQFDYLRLMTRVESLPVKTIFRNVHSLEQNSVIPDFLKILGTAPECFPIHIDRRENESTRPAQWLSEFLEARLNRPLSDLEKDGVEIIKGLIGVRHFISAPETIRKVKSTFAMGNNLLCSRYNLPITGLDISAPPPLHPATTVHYENIFSARLQNLLLQMSSELHAGNHGAAATRARNLMNLRG